uniref:Uncharacterized protein n=1 Tax=Pantoea phage Survivor TaxID=3232176 RepID=A0AAU8KZN0_9CAUD
MTKDEFIMRLRHGLKGKPKAVAELIDLEINRIARMKPEEFDEYIIKTTGLTNNKAKPKPQVEEPENTGWFGGRVIKRS